MGSTTRLQSCRSTGTNERLLGAWTSPISKLARLDDKDKAFVEAYHAERPLDPKVIEERIRKADFEPALAQRAIDYIRRLAAA